MTITLPFGAVKAVAEPLTRLGRGRDAANAMRFATMLVRVQGAGDEHEKKRLALIAQYSDNPLGFMDGEQIPEECRKALDLLFAEELEVDVEPLSWKALSESKMQPETTDAGDLAVLMHFGLLIDDVSGE